MTTKTTKTGGTATAKTGDWLVDFYRREARNYRSDAKAQRRWAAQLVRMGSVAPDATIQRAEILERRAAESDARAERRLAHLAGRA